MRVSDSEAAVPATEALPTLARGAALGRFLVLGLVGRGAMGEVYAAYDPDLDRKIAIKLLRARAGDSTDHRARLMREAKATAKISHPNVVVVYDAGTFGERVFIAMEFIEGHTLRYWLQSQDRPWHEILDAFIAAGRGLAAAHDKELVHRDFKPDNVMVTTQGSQVRVMDFGLARFVANTQPDVGFAEDLDGTIELRPGAAPPASQPTTESRHKLTATGTLLGTPAYMSPEQFRSQPADARSDQFSFCVSLFEAIYGHRPFGGRTLQELTDNVLEGRVVEPPMARRVPSWLRAVLDRGLRREPTERFASMNALLDELARHAVKGATDYARGAAAKLAGVWPAPVDGHASETPDKESMRRAFLATGKPYAATAFATASAVLDRYAQRWTDLYVDVCEATHVRGEQSAEVLDLRMACLNEGLADLTALCRLFREATAQVVENAVKAADSLGTLERCQDIKLLRAVVRPPEDAATRAEVERLRARLVDVRALERVGRAAASFEAVKPLVEEARRVGYGPLVAEALFLQGRLEIDAHQVQPATLEDAFFTAELSRHDEVAAMAAIYLLYDIGYVKGRFDVANVWSRQAETILRRVGGQDRLWGWFLSGRANLREMQGRLDEAIEDARRGIAAVERALGPGSPEVALCLGNLANHLAFGGDFAAALETASRAADVAVAALGREHPTTAQCFAQRAQFLYRQARYDDARGVASEALAVFERELDPRAIWISVPLRTLGLCHLAQRRFADARATLSRAAIIREAVGANPLRLAEVHFPLARALYELRGERDRALELARRARDEYAESAMTPLARADAAELDRWLAEHDRGRAPAAKRAPRRAAAKPAPRRGPNKRKPGRTRVG
jgi:serine/threonine protein kinase/tetratricopeptide (TPR) repeat protein